MAQMEHLFNIPGAGWHIPVGKVTHDAALRRRQFHADKGVCHSLIRTPVKDPDPVTVMPFQKQHLQKRSTLRFILASTFQKRNPFKESLQFDGRLCLCSTFLRKGVNTCAAIAICI